jgi:TetR/AcrR family transcriptional regulator, transcriptional repressor for nem operon
VDRSEQKQQTRQRIVKAAVRGFRASGYGGIGVDGLAKEAGLTSGAFYVHFPSKSEAFQAAVDESLAELEHGIVHYQTNFGKTWWPQFVSFYLAKRTCGLADSCGLQSLSPEVARSDAVARAVFEQGLKRVAKAIVKGPRSPRAPRDLDAACAALAALVGAVTLARAVNSAKLSTQIVTSVGRGLLGDHWDDT